MEVFNRKIIMRRDSVILSKSRNRLRQRRNLSDERIESENSIRTRKDGRKEVVMVDLEALVPKEHLLRKIEKVMDYEWLYL